MIQISDCRSRDEAIIWIIQNQFGRRNLPVYERSKLALKLKEIFAKQAKENQLSTLKQNTTVLTKLSKREEIFSEEEATDSEETVSQGAPPEPPKQIKPVNTRQEVAKVAGVSEGTLAKVEKIEKQAVPELKQALTERKVSINTAAEIAKMPEEERRSTERQVSLSLILDFFLNTIYHLRHGSA